MSALEQAPARPSTPPRVDEDGIRHITVKRCCNGCGRELGDATQEELEAAIFGPLPSVIDECGCRRPKRVQLSRKKGWRIPENTVSVARPHKYGNPIIFLEVGCQYPSLDDRGIATLVVRDFEVLAKRGTLHFPNWRHLGGERGPITWTYPSLDEIRDELAGKNLACWCDLDEPCHADVLLNLVNGAAA